MIYLDTSAILKLLRPEPETAALVAHIAAHGQHDFVTSAIATVETARALLAVDEPGLAAAAVPDSTGVRVGGATIAAIATTHDVLDAARQLPPAVLRSLDAIHVATAAVAGAAVDHVITYDKRMMVAAEAAGLRTASPA
ncbi:PIN domain-containing protein [Asanoa sp. WMMD1127]|uniref:PIN domain-containing protein n=1 Tax=Asanoa sp. WMMD1127 TaxID=3016107 RepID=UPI002416DE42|nr:PIN domain-containing protein [Asanoa sp. WMMD1127]MDG4823577.1 PIN domain-containing protein [Asanoa sp. WMMD1127]